jgi:Alpha-L-fucosidase
MFRGQVPDGPFQPAWESLKSYQCPDWYRDAKLGIWAHWSPQCVPEDGDWYARNMYTHHGSGTRTFAIYGRLNDGVPKL